MLEKLKEQLVELHLELPKYNLVVWTGGNVSARDPETGLVVIKASGIRYEEMRPQHMVVVDMDGKVVEGDYKPSSDVYSHLYIYKHRPDVRGAVHTHSAYATAFGTRTIIESFEKNHVSVNELVTCGGLPEKNKLLMQIYADVTGRELKVTASKQTPALGSAMFGAVAAGKSVGGYDSIFEAAPKMARLKKETFKPNPVAQKVYDQIYADYSTLHDYFGRGTNDVMKRMKQLRTGFKSGNHDN